jgi:hypothetical protein
MFSELAPGALTHVPRTHGLYACTVVRGSCRHPTLYYLLYLVGEQPSIGPTSATGAVYCQNRFASWPRCHWHPETLP